MKVTVKKVDDINYIMSGTVANSILTDRVAELKAADAKVDKKDDDKEKNFDQDAAGLVFKDFIDAGVKEANIEIDSILGQPGLKKYEKNEDSIYFEVEVSTSPEINVDGDFSDVIPEYKKPVAHSQAVKDKLEEFCTQQAPFTKIKEARAVEADDVAVIDFKGYIDGVEFEGGSAEKFNLKIGSNSFIPGFEEQIIGMNYNEERTVVVSFPKDYQSEDLAGKESKFEVKLHEIQEQEAIVPDDKFAQGILSDSTATLDTLKQKLAEQITSQDLSQLYMSELKPKIVEKLLERFDFTLPNNIVEQEIDAKIREKTKNFTKEQHKPYAEDKDKFHELRESVREEARNTIKIALIVEALAKKENIIVNDQEVLAALGYQAMMTGQDAQELVKYYEENNLMTSAKMGLTEDKLFGMMLGFANN